MTLNIAGERPQEKVGGSDERQRRPALCRQVPQVEDGTERRIISLRHSDSRVIPVDVVRPRSSPVKPVQSVSERRARDASVAGQVRRPRTGQRTATTTCSIGRCYCHLVFAIEVGALVVTLAVLQRSAFGNGNVNLYGTSTFS